MHEIKRVNGCMDGWLDEGRHDLQSSWLLICEKQDDGTQHTHTTPQTKSDRR